MNVYFLSDLHLGAPYFSDNKVAEKRVVSFLESIAEKADAIYLLGDVLDYWYEYRYVVPRGFVRFFGKLAELSDRGVKITWFIGNHDIWIFDYLPNELGIRVIDGFLEEEIDGRRFYMTHGDGIGANKPAFRMIRSIFRNKVCQKLFSGIHPRWTVPFAYRWSDHSRHASPLPSDTDATRMLEGLKRFSTEYLSSHPEVDYFLYGHLHLLERFDVRATTADGEERSAEVLVLGEWLSRFSFAHWNGETLTLEEFCKK